jgi:hypothetical protein
MLIFSAFDFDQLVWIGYKIQVDIFSEGKASGIGLPK